MAKEILLTNLDELVVEQENLSTTTVRDKWRVMEYETGYFKGKMLCAFELVNPKPITLKLGVKGIYKMYLGTIPFVNAGISMGVKINALDNKDIIDFKDDTWKPEQHWAPYSYAKEHFYKYVDFTKDDTIVINKPDYWLAKETYVAYIRLVESTKEEQLEYAKPRVGCVNYHFDWDFYLEEAYKNPSEWISRMTMLNGMGSEKVFFETNFDNLQPADEDMINESMRHTKGVPRINQFIKQRDVLRPAFIKTAHDMGMEIYGTHRMEMGDFFFCHEPNANYSKNYPEYRCKTRDGKVIGALSYAYLQTRQMKVAEMATYANVYDGISLIYHRGTHVAFEEPVLNAVQEKYGVDARTLQRSDERLIDVTCGFMTQFMRELRAAVPSDKKINVIVYYDAELSRQYGLDVETWAKEGLIDSVSQGIMNHFEDIGPCIDEKGLVDLEKYKEYIKMHQPVKRIYAAEAEAIPLFIKGSKEFLEIANKYGIEYFGSLAWEGNNVEDYTKLAVAQKEIGVKKFLSWDSNHKAKRLSRINAEKYISRAENIEVKTVEDFVVYHRVLSIDGHDISAVNPNWRG